MSFDFSLRQRVWLALGVASATGIGLWAIGALRNDTLDFWYLMPNLALGLVPLLLAVWLEQLLQTRAWKSWLPLFVTVLWVLFLPNSFYVLSDFIHLTEASRVDITQDVVMLGEFSFVGMAFGFISLAIVQREFVKRFNAQCTIWLAMLLLFLSSFAIYLGRDLRWNSWDIVVQPWALVCAVFQHLCSPLDYPGMFSITLSFFVMLVSAYLVLWETKKLLAKK